MKKTVIALSIILILGLSVFISAFSLSDLFKGTGKVVDNFEWELTEPVGICSGNLSELNRLYEEGILSRADVYNDLFAYDCIKPSRNLCDSTPGCAWTPEDNYDLPFKGDTISFKEVNEGWNLVPGLFYPSQIQNGSISPENILSIYGIISLNKDSNISNFEYVELFPEVDSEKLGATSIDLEFIWVYFNKSGSITYRILSHEDSVPGDYFRKGLNFKIITPELFIDNSGNPSDYFTINTFENNCDIMDAYFFEDEDWVSVTLDQNIGRDKLNNLLLMKTSNWCNFRFVSDLTTCEENEDGSVTLFNKEGDIVRTEFPTCLGSTVIGNPVQEGPIVSSPKCIINSSNMWDIEESTSLCDNICVNGACVE